MRISVYFLVAVAVAVTAVTIIIIYPTVYRCKTYTLSYPPKLVGSLAVNDILTNAELILKDAVYGPESVEVVGDVLYAGTQDGKVVEIRNGAVRKFSKFAAATLQCNGSYEGEVMCGRPLGIRSIDGKKIAVVDAYLGIFYVNFDENMHGVLLAKEKAIANNKPLRFMNDVDVISPHTIIFTDSSARWARRDYMNALLEGMPDGRVLKFDISTKKLEVLMDGLHFANGIQLFPDKESFLVAETLTARIRRHWIAGPKAGATEVFADNLPGYPDNIRLGTDGTFWVALGAVRHSDAFSFLDFLANKPNLRKVILQTLQVLPQKLREKLFKRFRTKHTMIIQLDQTGRIIRSAHDPKGRVISEVSQVTDNGEFLYFGSIHGKHIARLHKSHLTDGPSLRSERASHEAPIKTPPETPQRPSDESEGVETALPPPETQKHLQEEVEDEGSLSVEPLPEQESPHEAPVHEEAPHEEPQHETHEKEIVEEPVHQEVVAEVPESVDSPHEEIPHEHEEVPQEVNVDAVESDERVASETPSQ